jgi:two-component system cell cycle sensor histidine kinase/response regulator CckA
LTTEHEKKTATILVVEDEPGIRRIVATVLKRDGYPVLEANNPWEAAELLGSGLFHVDLLLTDIMMPGMTGPDFARELLEMQPHLKVVFATGCSREEVKRTMQLVDHKYFLQKPYTAEQLLEAVQNTLEA